MQYANEWHNLDEVICYNFYLFIVLRFLHDNNSDRLLYFAQCKKQSSPLTSHIQIA